jgi:hypothetical protein
MVAAIGAYTPLTLLELPLMVGLLTMGALLACLIAFFYSLYALRLRAPQPVAPLPAPTFDFVVFDSVVIGVFVGISLALAQLLQLQKSYWVPVSCLAVIQGDSLRAVWTKQLHRVLGTSIGLLLAWGLLLLPLDNWTVSLIMMALTFVVEMSILRHYAFAAVFITPMTILLAEALTLAAKAGLDIELTLKALGGGLAGSRCLDQKTPNYLAHSFNPGFKIDLHYKDLGLIMEAGRALGVPLPTTAVIQELFNALRQKGRGGLDHSGIITLLEDLAGVEVKGKK